MIRTTVTVPLEEVAGSFHSSPAWSPDGSSIAFTAHARNENDRLFVRRLNRFEAESLKGIDGAGQVFFSPDGEWIGFDDGNGKLKKASLSTGTIATICDVPFVGGAAWGTDHSIVFAGYTEGRRSSLMRVSDDGGTPVRLADPDLGKGEWGFRFPQFVPGHDVLVTTVWLRAGRPAASRSMQLHCAAASVAGSWRTGHTRGWDPVSNRVCDPRWVADGPPASIPNAWPCAEHRLPFSTVCRPMGGHRVV